MTYDDAMVTGSYNTKYETVIIILCYGDRRECHTEVTNFD